MSTKDANEAKGQEMALRLFLGKALDSPSLPRSGIAGPVSRAQRSRERWPTRGSGGWWGQRSWPTQHVAVPKNALCDLGKAFREVWNAEVREMSQQVGKGMEDGGWSGEGQSG